MGLVVPPMLRVLPASGSRSRSVALDLPSEGEATMSLVWMVPSVLESALLAMLRASSGETLMKMLESHYLSLRASKVHHEMQSC